MVRSFDFLGNIAIVNFPEKMKLKEKKKAALTILNSNKSIKTILEKSGKVKGRLRKPKLTYLAGEKTKEAIYRENDCTFRFNVDTTYFSPRLSNERKEIAGLIKKGENVLVCFAGVAPFSIVIAKNSKAGKVVSNELNKVANKYARLNAELNKVKNKIEFWDGDFKKIAKKKNEKFSVIVMPRPQLKETFLNEAFRLSKYGTRIYYYDFCRIEEKDKIIEKINNEAKKAHKKIKILNIKKAGEIAPYKIRLRVDFIVL
jgi:tRNA (guanine37-N1)-methyltransferase